MITEHNPPQSFISTLASHDMKPTYPRETAEQLLKQIEAQPKSSSRVSDGMRYRLKKAWIEDSQQDPDASRVMLEYELDGPATWQDLDHREQDRVIAEKVFGLQSTRMGGGWYSILQDGFPFGGTLPNYTTSMDAAWKLVEHFRERYDAHIGSAPLNYDVAFLDRRSPSTTFTASAASAPDAICRAALKIVGYEIKEEQ